ncbi:hypothetical protein RB593_001801 [Gaeumannomyces tritici]
MIGHVCAFDATEKPRYLPGAVVCTPRRFHTRSGRLWVSSHFDGGIRGYYSLLHLKMLMEYIKYEERRQAEAKNIGNQPRPGSSSFHPCHEPDHVSHITVSPDNASSTTHFLPCHYFDYVGGTSTGALRMPVDDCIEEYKTLGDRMFGNPRRSYQGGWQGLVSKKNKSATIPLEEAIQDVIRRCGKISGDQEGAMTFKSPTGLCRAIVLAGREVASGGEGQAVMETLFLLPSYDNFAPPPSEARLNAISPLSGASIAAPRNPGQRATIATNPAEEVKKELRNILRESDKKIRTWVSIGTTRPSETHIQSSDPEFVHRSLEEWASDARYFRFNGPNGLRDQNVVEMSEWWPPGSGTQTMEKMDTAFANYMLQPGNHTKLRECAQLLVECRRRRTTESRSHWDRYAFETAIYATDTTANIIGMRYGTAEIRSSSICARIMGCG